MHTEWRTDGQVGRYTLEQLPEAPNKPSLQFVQTSLEVAEVVSVDP